MLDTIINNLESLLPVIQVGVIVGIFIAIFVGGVRLGWKFAPWILAISFIIYLLG